MGAGRAARPQHPDGGPQVARRNRRHEEPPVPSRGGQLAVRGGLRGVAGATGEKPRDGGHHPGLRRHRGAGGQGVQEDLSGVGGGWPRLVAPPIAACAREECYRKRKDTVIIEETFD